jgi:hypothetical protein
MFLKVSKKRSETGLIFRNGASLHTPTFGKVRIPVAISLLLLLFFQTMLLSPWMQLSLKLHKEEVKERIEEGEEDLVKLSFRVDSFAEKVQRKGEKEFLYRGVMYDIVEAERQGRELLLTVYRDEEETEMREKHQTVRKRQEEEGEKKSERAWSIHPFKYDRMGTPELQCPLSFSTLGNQRPHPSFLGTYLEVPVPPPC